jgi:hypothetical protein
LEEVETEPGVVLKEMFSIAESLLRNRTWSKSCLRLNIAKPEDVVTGSTGFQRVLLQSELVHETTKQDQLLRQALSEIAPERWGAQTRVTANRNVVCQPHVDKNNAEYSYICFLGDYDGGALVFENGERVEEPYRWHKIDADKTKHWNEPITRGTKYSVVIYRRHGSHTVKKVKQSDATTRERD